MEKNPTNNENPSTSDHHISDYFNEHDMQSSTSLHRDLLQTMGEMMADLVDEFMDLHPDRKPRVTAETIESFEVVQAKDLASLACNICLEEYTKKDGDNQTACQLPCQHKFHFNCIKEWLNHATNCPSCRFELPTDDPLYESFKKRKAEKKRLEADVAELHNSMFS